MPEKRTYTLAACPTIGLTFTVSLLGETHTPFSERRQRPAVRRVVAQPQLLHPIASYWVALNYDFAHYSHTAREDTFICKHTTIAACHIWIAGAFPMMFGNTAQGRP